MAKRKENAVTVAEVQEQEEVRGPVAVVGTISKEGDIDLQTDEVEEETEKLILKDAEKLVKKLDKIVTDLNQLQYPARDLRDAFNDGGVVNEKDQARFLEMYNVIYSTAGILYHMTERMARKYVGKNVKPLGAGRKSLKK